MLVGLGSASFCHKEHNHQPQELVRGLVSAQLKQLCCACRRVLPEEEREPLPRCPAPADLDT